MTTQIPDSCMIDGRRWVIESWSGDHACVPPLRLSYPYFDYWEVPWPIDDEEDATTEEIVVEFEEGRVMGRE